MVPEVVAKNSLPVHPLFCTRLLQRTVLSQQRFVLTAVPALSQVQPEPEEEEGLSFLYRTREEDTAAEDDTSADDKTSPYAQWDASTVYGANWGSFEISLAGKAITIRARVKWWSMGVTDLNCGVGGAWTDLGAY